MTGTQMLIMILRQGFETCHEMSAPDDAPLDENGMNAFAAENLDDLEELVTNFIAERF